jgi:hypothetical protein
MVSQYHHLASLIKKCRYEEKDVDRQIELLQQINRALPESIRIKLPSLITNDYIDKALNVIEENLLQRAVAA